MISGTLRFERIENKSEPEEPVWDVYRRKERKLIGQICWRDEHKVFNFWPRNEDVYMGHVTLRDLSRFIQNANIDERERIGMLS
jgi:hypothetical protein